MPGMTDQQQRDMEAQLRADLAAARRARDKAKARRQEMAATLDAACTDAAALAVERDALRARLENAEVALGKALSVIDRDSKSLGAILSGVAGRHAQWEMQERVSDAVRCAHAALGAAGERSEGENAAARAVGTETDR